MNYITVSYLQPPYIIPPNPATMASQAVELSPQRAHALFDLLLHHQTYFNDCVRFNRPDGIDDYGPPFDDPVSGEPSNTPVLQTLLYRFILPLPGVNSFSPTFWSNVRTLVRNFATANLSDSYDHAGLGLRRTLATGASALLEYPGRGVFGKLPESKEEDDDDDDDNDNMKEYDHEDPEALKNAWKKFLQKIVYGDMIDQLFDQTAETDLLSDHEPLVQAAHEYILLQ